jgi:sporulation protein YlmC with PRC-barrel domain
MAASTMTVNESKIVSASTLAGYRVRSHENEDLGAVEEILIHPTTGRIAYAVLCFGGALGFGDRLFAIPWTLLALNAPDHTLILSWDRERLQGAPAFHQDEWPDFGDEMWEREIRDYYGSGMTFTEMS